REPRYGDILWLINGSRCRPHHHDVAVGLHCERTRAIDAIGEECRPRDPNQRPARRVPHQSKILFVGNSVAEPGDDRNVALDCSMAVSGLTLTPPKVVVTVPPVPKVGSRLTEITPSSHTYERSTLTPIVS